MAINPYEEAFSRQLQGALSTGERKKAILEQKAQEKRNKLNAVNPGNIRRIDGDTFELVDTGERIRTTDNRPGTAVDTFETDPRIYEKNKGRFKAHARSYGFANGIDPDDVTIGNLTDAAALQKERSFERIMEKAEAGTLHLERNGQDMYGRTLAQFTDTETGRSAFEDLAGMDENASYLSDYNAEQRLRDAMSGNLGQHLVGSGERSYKDLAKDQAVNLTYGAGEMVNSLAQAVAIGTTFGDETAEFFEENRESLQKFKDRRGSEEMLRGERMAQKRSERRQAVSSLKKAQYVAQGDGEIEAGVKAGIGEFTDTLQDFWQNPGRALDSAVTSLPYMIGVGTAGAQAARIAGNRIRKSFAKDLAEFASKGKGGVGPLRKGQNFVPEGAVVRKYMTSDAAKKEISSIVDKVGIGTVGLTEGMTNSADVYAEIMKMSEEEASQSEEYQKLRSNGLDHEEALHELGVSAYAETLIATTLLATAAAAGTGAGAFEARLFTGIRNPLTKKAAKPLTARQIGRGKKKIKKAREAEALGLKKSLLATVATGTGKGVKKTAPILKKPAAAGGKELAEETIQSGGGELVSQITKQEATGEEIGPGVGGAAAEGAVVGFLSGFGMSSITSTVKAGARKIVSKKDGFDEATNHYLDTSNRTAGLTRTGGATEAADKAAERPDYNAASELEKALAVLDADETNQNIFDNYNAMERHFLEAIPALREARKKAIEAGDAEAVAKIQAIEDKATHYAQVYDTGIRNTLKNNTDDYLNDKLDEKGVEQFEAVIEEASIQGIKLDPKLVEKLDQNTKNILTQNDEMNELLRQLQDPEARAEAIAAEIAAKGVDPESEYGQELKIKYEQAHASKMGAGRFSLGGSTWVRGVERYIKDLSGAMQEDPRLGRGHVKTILDSFDKFLTGQQNKINQLREVIKNPPKDGKFQLHVNADKAGTIVKGKSTYKFSEHGATRMLNALVAEQTTMEGVQKSFAAKNLAYQNKLNGVEGVAPEVTTTTTEEAPTGRLAALIEKFKAFSAKKLAAHIKEKGIEVKDGVTGSALVQFVAQWTLDLENNPEGSDTGEDSFALTPDEVANAAALDTTGEETGGAFLKRIGPGLANRDEVLITPSQNRKRTVQSFLRNRGYVRERKTNSGNIVWSYRGSEWSGNPLAFNGPKKVKRPPSVLDILSRDEDGIDLSDGVIREAFPDSNSSDRTPAGRQIFYKNKGLTEETLPAALRKQGIPIPEKGIDEALAWVAQELLAMVNGAPLTYTGASEEQAAEYAAYENYADQADQADQTLEEALPEQPAKPVRERQRSAEGEGSTVETPPTPAPTPGTREAGVANAQAVYDAAVANTPDITADEIAEVLVENRPKERGPERAAYQEHSKKLYNKRAAREKGPNDANLYNEMYQGLKAARTAAQAAAANGPFATYQDWFEYVEGLSNLLPGHMLETLRNKRTAAVNALNTTDNVGVDNGVPGTIFEAEVGILEDIADELIAMTDMPNDAKIRALAAFKDDGADAGSLEHVDPQQQELVADPESVDPNQSGPIGHNSTLYALRKNTRSKLTKTITAIKEDLGDSGDAKLTRDLRVAQAALKDLDNPQTKGRALQFLISSIEDVIQQYLTSEDAHRIANKAHYYKNSLTLLSEMGIDGSQTKEFMNERDVLLEELLMMISKDARTSVPMHVTANKVTVKVWGFIAQNPLAAPNAFLAGGVRFRNNMGLNASGGTVQQTTASINLPTRLSDSYTQAGEKNSSWLAKYPNWRTKIKADYVAMDPEEKTFEAVGAFVRFEEKFRATLLDKMVKWGPDSISGKSLWAYNSEFVHAYLLEDPSWYFRDQQGNLNENLITAMALEAFNYVSGAGQRTLVNTPEEIANILGESKGYTPDAEEIAGLSTVGDGIENVYDLIGNELMKHLNIKGSGLATGQLRSVMPRVLASRTVTTLSLMGLADINAVDLEKIKGNTPNKDGKRKFLRLKTKEEVPNEPSTEFTWDVWQLYKMGAELSENGTLEKMFGTVAETEGPSLKPFENVETKIRKTVMTAPDETSAASKADQDRSLSPNPVLQEAAKLFPTGEQYLQINHNYAPDLRAVHHTKKDNIKGRNRNFARDWNSAMAWLTRLAELGATQFYVPNRTITNLRTMIISTFINTQASKVHRPLFPKTAAMKEYDINMTPDNARGNAEATAFYRSVAQKLGGKLNVEVGNKELSIKVEYLTDEQVLDNVQKLIDDPKWHDLIDHINDPQDRTEAGQPIFNQKQLDDFLAAELYNEENGETYMTLANLAALEKAKTDNIFQTASTLLMYAPVQTDATTSGFANSLMQLATNTEWQTGRIKVSLQRVGAAFRGDPTTATQYMANNPDSYQKITKLIHENMSRMLGGLATSIDANGNLQTTPIANKLAGLKTELKKIQEGEDSEFMDDETYNRKVNWLKGQIRIYSMQSNHRLMGFGKGTLGEIDGKKLGIIPELVEADNGDVTGAGRQFAKDPFMLGNYNAGRKSAKAALASNSYSELLDLLSTIDDPATLQGALEELFLARNEAVPIMYESGDLKGDQVKLIKPADISKVAADLVKSLQADRTREYARQEDKFNEHEEVNLGSLIDFSVAQQKVFRTIISDTYGEALHVALDAELFHLKKPRNAIHKMAFISNAIFQKLLDKRVKDFQKANFGMYPDHTQIKYLVDQMVNENLFPGIPSAVSKGLNDKIEAVKRESAALYINNKAVRGDIGFEGKQQLTTELDKDGNPVRQEALTMPIEDRGFSDNPGVAPAVRVIQSIEAVIQSDLLAEYAFTNTYDGQGAEGTLARLIGVSANESAIKRNYEYNMFDAMFGTMVSMMRALHPTSNQLTTETKDALLTSLATKYDRKGDTPQEAFDLVLGDLKVVQTDIHMGRKIVWEEMWSLNNYMESELSEVNVAQVLQNVPDIPTIYDAVNPSLEALTEAYNAHIANVDQNGVREDVKAKMTTALINGISNGLNGENGAIDVLQRFMRANPKGNQIGLGYFMDLLKDSLKKSGGNENLTGLVNQLYALMKDVPAIRGIKIHLSTEKLVGPNGGNPNGMYTPRKGRNEARIDVWAGAPNFLGTMLHETFHAVTGNYINEAELENPQMFQEIVSQALAFAKALQNIPESSNPLQRLKDRRKANIGATLQHIIDRGDAQSQKDVVSEMISYVTTEFLLDPDEKTRTEEADMLFLNEFDAVLGSLRLIVKVATDAEVLPANRQAQASASRAAAAQGVPLLHEGSTSEDIDTIAFLERYVTQLPAGQMKAVLDDVAKYERDPESLRHNQRLDFVIDNIVHPGLRSIDPLTVKISQNPDGTRNVGQVIGNTIYVEAAGNRLTANIDMSMKEVVVHEYLHPIVRWALGQQTTNGKRDPGHWDVQQRLKKLFNLARDNINPLDLMPLAPTGDIVYAQQQARERYDYIFNNENGDMSEFLINGLVNERLIELLAEMDAPNTTQPVWEGPTYQSLVNIMGRIMRLFTKKVNKSATGKVDKELQMLAAGIVAINMQNTQKNLHRQRSQPRMDTLDGWLANQIGEKVAEPLARHAKKWRPSNSESTAKRAAYNAVTLMLNATNEDFQKHAQEYFRELGGQKNNALMEMAAELVPSQKSLMHWKEMLRKSNHVVDRARRSAIEHMQKAIRQHFDPSFHRKLRTADKAALTHVGMRADLSALLGTNNNWERLQRLVNSSAAVDAEITSREAELDQVSQGDVKLYNILHNQTMGLAELMIIGQTPRANQQQNPHMIANQKFFTDPANRRPLADVDGAIKVIDELKTLYALKLINNTAPQDMERFANIVNHEMSRNISTPNGFQSYMSRHMNFKEQSLARSFKGNPAMMNSGYVYEQYNPDLDIKFTTHDPGEVRKMKDKNYHQVGNLPRDPRDPNQEPMIIWKGLDGHAMYSKTVVSPTDTEARGHDPFDSLRLLNGVNTSAAATLAKYDVNIMKARNEKDVLKQLDHPDVRSNVMRSVPIHNEKGEITNYRYMMSMNNKKTILEANQNFDYLLGRMFGSLEDREATIDINRKTAKLLYEEYQAGHGKDKTLRFVEISKYSKSPEAREMWDLLPTDMRNELTNLFGSEHFFIRDDAIKLVLGFRKLSIGNAKWLGKNAFAARAAERVWMDVIRLLKIKIVLTMPDVVLGNMASNIAFLTGQGIPPEFVTKEIMQGLKGINMWMKDEEALANLKQDMQETERTRGAATPRQRAKRAELELNMANNPIAKLAEEGVFTGIADELEPDTWNWRNKIMQWVGEASDSFVPAAVVSGVKEVMIVPGAQTFKVALAATQYADFIARHVQYKYDTEVRGIESEEAIQKAIDNFIYYDIPQNEWQALAEDYGLSMFSKYFYRIQQQIFKLYKNHPVSAMTTLAIQKMMTTFPFSSNVTDYAFLNNFDVTSRLHLMPLRTMDGADMLTPALLQIALYPFGGDR